MENCFDLDVCLKHGFKVYVYPKTTKVSEIYDSILDSVKKSVYHTINVEEACLKILALDTLDRYAKIFIYYLYFLKKKFF